MFVVLELVVQFCRFILFTFLRRHIFALYLPRLLLRFILFQFYNAAVEQGCLVKLVNKTAILVLFDICVYGKGVCIFVPLSSIWTR